MGNNDARLELGLPYGEDRLDVIFEESNIADSVGAGEIRFSLECLDCCLDDGLCGRNLNLGYPRIFDLSLKSDICLNLGRELSALSKNLDTVA